MGEKQAESWRSTAGRPGAAGSASGWIGGVEAEAVNGASEEDAPLEGRLLAGNLWLDASYLETESCKGCCLPEGLLK
jgi:hypothetical protein